MRKYAHPITSLVSFRDEFGVIVTVREIKTGRIFSMHEPGPRLEALRAVAEKIDRAAGAWRVICYSTPETIIRDLKGARDRETSNGRTTAVTTVEANALSKINRLDLLDESRYMGDSRKYKRRK